MKKNKYVAKSLVFVACIGLLMPQVVLGKQPITNPHVKRTLDITLHEHGLLIGQVVNPQGKSKQGVEVRLIQRDQELVRTQTDKKGRFAIKGLQSGNYKIATRRMSVPVRVWPKTTAPPAVAAGALLVEGTVVRGQESILAPPANEATLAPEGVTDPVADSGATYDPAPYEGNYPNSYDGYASSGASTGGGIFGMSPLVVGAGVAAAIAIPVAISNGNDDDDDGGAGGGAGEPAS